MPEEKHEAVEGVLGEMLGVAQLIEDGNRAPILPQDLRMWAERIKAAAKRERENADLRAIHRCHDCERENATPCNVAAMREALKKIKKLNRYDLGCIRSKKRRDEFDARILEIERTVRAALAAPARNADRFATAKEALDAFIREKEITSADVDSMNLRDFFDWLFERAKGGAS